MTTQFDFDQSEPPSSDAHRWIIVDTSRVIIERWRGGAPMRIEIEPQTCLGVVLSLDETACGRAAYRVKLWHPDDAELTVCLLETFESQDIVAEWTSWALYFGLPKFIERAPGQLEGAERRIAQAAACQAPNWRRRGAALANRRSRSFRRGNALSGPVRRRA